MHVRRLGTASMALLDISSKALALWGGKPNSRGQEVIGMPAVGRVCAQPTVLCTAIPTTQGREGMRGYLTTRAAHLVPQGLTHNNIKHTSVRRAGTLSHGHTTPPPFSALCCLPGKPWRRGWACWGWMPRVPARQVFPLWGNLQAHSRPSSVSGLDHSAFPSSLQTRQGKLEPRRHQHCSCWGHRSVPEKTNAHKSQVSAHQQSRAHKEEAQRGLLCQGPWIILASTLRARAPVPQLTLLC